MATATWFDYNAYMANKLVQVNAIDPKVQYTPETLKAEFEKAGYVGEEGAFKHFEQYGKTEDVAPNALFDADEYITAKAADFFKTDKPTASQIAEVAKAFADGGMSAWDHYVTYGSSEGVEPSFSFNTDAYLTAKAAALNAGKYDGKENWTADDVAAAIKASGSTVLEHFMANGGGGEFEVGVSYKGVTADGVKNPFIDNNPPVPVPDPNPGDTYPLTTKVDTFTGTAKDDVFTGVASRLSTEKTLNEGDQLDGGDGIDTLQVDMKASFAGFTGEGKMVNVEHVELTSTATSAVSFSAKGSTGIDTYTLHSSKAAINLTDVDSTDITVNVDGLKSGTTSIGFASKVADGDADEMGLGLNNVGTVKADKTAEASVKVSTKGIENLSIEATGANVVDLTDAATESITAVGSGSLKVTKVSAGIDTFNAAGVKGNVVADLSGATLKDVQGGAGDDTFTVSNLETTANLSGGLGNDTLVLKGMNGILKPSMSGFENVRVDGFNTSALTFSAKNATDFSALELANDAQVVLADVASEFTVNSLSKASGVQAGSVTLTSATDLVYNTVADKSIVDADKTAEVNTTVTASKATNVTANVGANTSFGGTLIANAAQSLTVNAEGVLGAAAKFTVNKAEAVTVNAAQGGQAEIGAAEATTVRITSGEALNLTNSVFSKAVDVTLEQNKGELTGAVAFAAINTLTVSGEGNDSEITLGALGDAKLDSDVTVNASGLKSGFTAASVNAAADHTITLNVGEVTGDVAFSSTVTVADKDSKHSGTVNVNASGLGGSLTLGVLTAANVSVDASGVMGSIAISALQGDVISFDATDALATQITVTSITVGKELTFTGGEFAANASTIDIAGTDITAFLQGGMAADNFSFTSFLTNSAEKLVLTGDLGDGTALDQITINLNGHSTGDVELDLRGLVGVETANVTSVDAGMTNSDFTYYGVDGSDLINLASVTMGNTGDIKIDFFANDGAKDVVTFASAFSTDGGLIDIKGFEAGEAGSDVLIFTKGLVEGNAGTALTASSAGIMDLAKNGFNTTVLGNLTSTGILEISGTGDVAAGSGDDAGAVWSAIVGTDMTSAAGFSSAKLLFLVDDGSDSFIWYFDGGTATDPGSTYIKLLGKVEDVTDFAAGDINFTA